MDASKGDDKKLPWQLTPVEEVTARDTQESHVILFHPHEACVCGGYPASTHTILA